MNDKWQMANGKWIYEAPARTIYPKSCLLLLLLLLLPTAARGQEVVDKMLEVADVKKDDSVSEQLKGLRKQIDDLNGGVRALGGAIEKDVTQIRKDLLESKDKADQLKALLAGIK